MTKSMSEVAFWQSTREALLPRVLKIKSLIKGRSLDRAKKLAGFGSMLSIFGLDEIGYALVLAGMYDLGDYYNNEKIKRNALWWFIWWFIGTSMSMYVILTIGYAIIRELAPLLLGYRSAMPTLLDPSILLGAVAVAIAVLVILEVFYVLSARRLKEAYAELANVSGVGLFNTAAKFYWWGSLLVVILVGFVLILISWIISAIAFFSMKLREPTSV